MYYYLYYWLYWFAKNVGTVDAAWTALLLITVLVYFNIATILFWLVDINDIVFVDPRIIGIATGVLIGIINYRIFLRNDAWQNIINELDKASKRSKVISSIGVVLYIIATWCFAHI